MSQFSVFSSFSFSFSSCVSNNWAPVFVLVQQLSVWLISRVTETITNDVTAADDERKRQTQTSQTDEVMTTNSERPVFRHEVKVNTLMIIKTNGWIKTNNINVCALNRGTLNNDNNHQWMQLVVGTNKICASDNSVYLKTKETQNHVQLLKCWQVQVRHHWTPVVLLLHLMLIEIEIVCKLQWNTDETLEDVPHEVIMATPPFRRHRR